MQSKKDQEVLFTVIFQTIIDVVEGLEETAIKEGYVDSAEEYRSLLPKVFTILLESIHELEQGKGAANDG